MKKKWLIIPALLLAAAGMLILACPSEPNPGEQIEEYDFIITGGNHVVKITDFLVTQGKEYLVTFVIEAADDDFYDSYMGGKLLYKDGEDDKILSGWKMTTPEFISGPGTHRWIFKAGEVYDDDKPIANPATTPSEENDQYFTLNVQTNDYKQYPSYYEFRIKGSIKVEERPVPEGSLTNSGEIARTYGTGHNETLGKGNIEGAAFEKVKAAAGNGAYLRFYITDCNVSTQAGKDGNGVGSVGNRSTAEANAMLSIPKGTPANSNFSFTVDYEVEWLLDLVGAEESHLFVNMWDANCSKIELWEYK